MIEMFRGIVKSAKDAGKGFRLVTAIGRGDVAIEDAQLWQHRGFASRPKSGDPVLFLKRNGLIFAVGSTTADCPSDIEEGETVVYACKDSCLRMKASGEISFVAPKGVDVEGDLRVTGEVSDLVGKLSALRDKYNAHKHVGNLASPTSPTMPDGVDMGGA